MFEKEKLAEIEKAVDKLHEEMAEATRELCVGVDYGNGESYTAFHISAGNYCGKAASAVQLARTLKAIVIVPDLRTLDNLVAMGLQPSQIMVSSELQMGVSVDWVVTGCEGG